MHFLTFPWSSLIFIPVLEEIKIKFILDFISFCQFLADLVKFQIEVTAHRYLLGIFGIPLKLPYANNKTSASDFLISVLKMTRRVNQERLTMYCMYEASIALSFEM